MSRGGKLRLPARPASRDLRSAAARRSAECRDLELAGVLQRVADRRAVRGRPGVAASSDRASSEPGQLLEIEDVSPDVRLFRIVKPPGFSFAAGQYIRVGLQGVAKSRKYSIASAPHDPHLELCIERVAGGQLTTRLFDLATGARLQLADEAKGSFGLDPQSRTHLLVATVTGIAPLRSMLRDALHRRVPARFLVLHGASYADELAYRTELQTLATEHADVVYEPTVSRPTEPRNSNWTGHTGRVDPLASRLAATLDPGTTTVYACGNSGMVSNVRAALTAAGFTVRSEVFDD